MGKFSYVLNFLNFDFFLDILREDSEFPEKNSPPYYFHHWS